MVKNPPAKAGAAEEGSVPGWGRSFGGGNGSPLQFSCLENLTDSRALWATVYRVKKRQTRLSMHAHTLT